MSSNAQLNQLFAAAISPALTDFRLEDNAQNDTSATSTDTKSHCKRFLTAVIGLIITAIAAARRPEFAAFDARLKTLSDFDGAVATAQKGFFRDASRSKLLVCFHCAVESAAADGQHRSDCAVAKLGLLLSQPSNGCLATEAGRAESVLRQLNQLLALPAVSIAESFGFQRNLLAWALARNLLGPDGGAPADRAGQLMRLADLCEARFLQSGDLLRRHSLEALLAVAEAADAPSTRPFAAAAPSGQAPPSSLAPPAETIATAVAEADDQCVRCRRRQRSRVLLPCAHFVACDACADGADRRCPACGSATLASVRAFIC